ncbi:hypothetical protein BABINDRAFT_94480 [Babjeviella inositovora NRRL Y-12698]|uniref:Uncharacterized protein n=1 Tax=Babjeviella inositovora NRRL Y-12698 TaxID=984486 RepID=A0A1E3QJN1_9ASCO|nr:uncharacterized protein BABINDRAFT_94480 [Babjeviella inositovora NRRL Y-12698]ODQ77828.1 hypothetical protein BABINDRAFT_94480 [Babjeviella inositovora NRRL Y-12698]
MHLSKYHVKSVRMVTGAVGIVNHRRYSRQGDDFDEVAVSSAVPYTNLGHPPVCRKAYAARKDLMHRDEQVHPPGTVSAIIENRFNKTIHLRQSEATGHFGDSTR